MKPEIYIPMAQDDYGYDVIVPWNEASWLEPQSQFHLVGTGVPTDGLQPLHVPTIDKQ